MVKKIDNTTFKGLSHKSNPRGRPRGITVGLFILIQLVERQCTRALVNILFCSFSETTLTEYCFFSIVTGLIVMTIFDTLPYSICVEVFGSANAIGTSSIVLFMSGVGLVMGSLLGE